jgi:hypothetical protein
MEPYKQLEPNPNLKPARIPSLHVPAFLLQGWGAKLVSELGGLCPGAGYRFLRQRLDCAWAAPLSPTVALNVSLGAGGCLGTRAANRRRGMVLTTPPGLLLAHQLAVDASLWAAGWC